MTESTDADHPLDADQAARALEARLGPGVLYPLSYAVPSELIVEDLPEKTEPIAGLMSRAKGGAYRFGPGEQDGYYQQYLQAYFAVTGKRGGWDCLRHLEILANGCIPLFEQIEQCPRFTLTHYPKRELQQLRERYAPAAEQNNTQPIQAIPIDSIDPAAYRQAVLGLLAHCRAHLSTEAMARYFLKWMKAQDAKSILFLTDDRKPNYSCEMLMHGLRTVLGEGLIDVGKRWWLYKSAEPEAVGQLYGNGFTYTRHLDDIPIDRGNVKKRLRAGAFDLVVLGNIELSTPLLPLIRRYYDRQQVALIDGGDYDQFPGAPGRSPTRRPLIQKLRVPDRVLNETGVVFKREINDQTIDAFAQASRRYTGT